MDLASIEANVAYLRDVLLPATLALTPNNNMTQVQIYQAIAQVHDALATYSNVVQQMRIAVILANIPHAPGVSPA